MLQFNEEKPLTSKVGWWAGVNPRRSNSRTLVLFLKKYNRLNFLLFSKVLYRVNHDIKFL